MCPHSNPLSAGQPPPLKPCNHTSFCSCVPLVARCSLPSQTLPSSSQAPHPQSLFWLFPSPLGLIKPSCSLRKLPCLPLVWRLCLLSHAHSQNPSSSGWIPNQFLWLSPSVLPVIHRLNYPLHLSVIAPNRWPFSLIHWGHRHLLHSLHLLHEFYKHPHNLT